MVEADSRQVKIDAGGRHPSATRLAYQPCLTRLAVEDLAAEPARSTTDLAGYGLTGMRERAELLGGSLTAAVTPTGFRVELDVPA